MPHATAVTSTSTSYRQLTSNSLRLPPSPPLLALAAYIPPAPFSYDFSYPSHPLSYPPAAVLETLPQSVMDEDGWAGQETLDEAQSEVDTEEEQQAEQEEAEAEAAAATATQTPFINHQPAGQWVDSSKASHTRKAECEESEVEDVDSGADSDDEWSVGDADVDITELDTRSSYAPSYAASYACSDAEEEEEETSGASAGLKQRRQWRAASLGWTQ